jgi:fatty-acyl-CoA synthase
VAWQRICATLPSTETFKQKKQQLMHEDLDPGIVADPLYVRDPKSGAYRLLDHAVHAQLIDGFLRL